jgi:hypothetical protein
MDVATIAQIASTVTTMIFVAVIGLGYYFTVKVSRETLRRCVRSVSPVAVPRS